jgi:hypothetical protein
VVGLVVLTITSLTVVLVGADRHQARIRDELEQALGDTTYDDVDAVLRGDGEQLEAGARFSDSEQIFSAASVRADGFNYTEDRIELRWPAIYFGFRRQHAGRTAATVRCWHDSERRGTRESASRW